VTKLPPTPTDHDEREHFFSAAKLVAALTMLSRITGLLRDMLIVPIGGAVLADRFWTAFAIPNLFRRLFGEGALSAAFVPVFTEVAEAEGWGRARVVLANVAGLLAVVLAAVFVAVVVTVWLLWETVGGSDLRAFFFQMIVLMMPFMVTVCLLALGSAALNCRGRFWYPAFAPILLNAGLIVAARFVAPAITEDGQVQFYIIGLGLVAAGLAQLIGVVWMLARAGLAVVPKLRPVLAETRRVARYMGPMLIPLGVLQFSAFADRFIALAFTVGEGSALQPGVVRCLYAAARLYMLPLGVLAIPVATAVFPLLGRYAARQDAVGLRDTTNRAIRLCLFLGIPAGAALFLLAPDAIKLIYQRGQFTAEDTQRSAAILRMYCLGLWAYFCNQILLRAFFAIKQPRKPMLYAAALVVVNITLVLVGIHTPLRGAAIGLATAITASINTLLLLGALRRKWGRLGFTMILASLARIAVASAGMGGAIWLVRITLPDPLRNLLEPMGLGSVVSLVLVAALCVVGAGVYFILVRLLRAPELAELLRRKSTLPAEADLG
jgi:putative peptidoglycan lipid II flippase